ncbi:MAG: alkaline phosphatase family protein [Microcoleaceae cyanobacterium]
MTAKKVLFIGLDSADPELLKQWSEDGSLPNLQKIWQSSIWGDVKIPKGFSNGAMWPSLFTGVNPSKHGRYNYLYIEPGTYNFKHLFDEDTDYQALPFWVDLSKQGKRVGIVDVPRAPLTKEINGFQIADWLTHDRRNAIIRSYPENLAQNIIGRW